MVLVILSLLVISQIFTVQVLILIQLIVLIWIMLVFHHKLLYVSLEMEIAAVVLLYRTLVMFPNSIGLISHSLAVFHIRIIAVLHNRLFQEHTLMLVMYHHPSSFNPAIIPVHQLVAGLYLNLISFNLVIIPVRHLVAGLYLNFVRSLVKISPIFLIIHLGVIHSKLWFKIVEFPILSVYIIWAVMSRVRH